MAGSTDSEVLTLVTLMDGPESQLALPSESCGCWCERDEIRLAS